MAGTSALILAINSILQVSPREKLQAVPFQRLLARGGGRIACALVAYGTGLVTRTLSTSTNIGALREHSSARSEQAFKAYLASFSFVASAASRTSEVQN
jgi:hypothetical protein